MQTNEAGDQEGSEADIPICFGSCCCNAGGDEDIEASPESELLIAVEADDEAAVAALLSAGADPNEITEAGSMLNEAAWRGHLGIVKLLLAAGANPNVRGPRGLTPLIDAAEQVEIARALLDAGADFDAVDDNEWSVLANAAHSIAWPNPHQECAGPTLDLLLERGADPNIGVPEACAPLGLLLSANPCSEESERAALALLSHGADPNAQYKNFGSTFDRTWSVLALAAFHGSPSLVHALLDYGADPNLSFGFGLAPLNLALERGEREIVALLEAAGATVPTEVDTDLQRAIAWGSVSAVASLLPLARLDSASASELLLLSIERWGHREIVRALIEYGADPNTFAGDPDHPRSVLSLAVNSSRAEAVRVLLAAGADPERYEEPSTLMNTAAQQGDIAVLEALINYGIPVDVPDHEAWTPLMAACHCNKPAAVRFLISRGANVNAATLNNQPEYFGGATPLITAAKIKEGDPTILTVLLDCGADLEATDCAGNTALHWATICEAADALKLLLERGAKPNAETPDHFTFTIMP